MCGVGVETCRAALSLITSVYDGNYHPVCHREREGLPCANYYHIEWQILGTI